MGRVAFLEAGEPWVLPVVYRLDGSRIVFRSAVGAKLDLAERPDPDRIRDRRLGRRGPGRLERAREGHPACITDADEIARLDTLGVEQWVRGPYPMRWIMIIPDEITGRRISPHQPS